MAPAALWNPSPPLMQEHAFHQPLREYSRGNKPGLFLGTLESWQAAWASGVPESLAQRLLGLHCSLTWSIQPSFLPGLLPLGSALHHCLTAFPAFPGSLPFSVKDICPYKYLVHLFMSWCLFLRGPGLTAVFLRYPFNIILGVSFTFSLVDLLFSRSQVVIFFDLFPILVECILHMGGKIVEALHDWKLNFNLTLEDDLAGYGILVWK